MKKLNPALCRTLLFTPANKPERYQKSGTIRATDMVVLDLEDAVPFDAKDQARKTLLDYLTEHGEIPANHPMITAIRINPISTQAGIKDIAALADAKIHVASIILPKVQNVQEIELYDQLINTGRPQKTTFIAAIETAFGLQYAHEIAAHSSVVALGFGGADLCADLGISLDINDTLPYRARIVQAARYASKPAWDVPYLNFRDEAGLRQETQLVKKMGYGAKIAIHPAQLAPIAEIFFPTEDEINEAKAIVETYAKAGGIACQYKGAMLDVPVVKKCQDLLDLVQSAKGDKRRSDNDK
ncbi:MAG: CoA ester lyase [Desulfobacteraceae bacterium]|nr:CoA ester lyase [Desulfobacteraceae bacterium]